MGFQETHALEDARNRTALASDVQDAPFQEPAADGYRLGGFT
jgi:hypothetical protein